MNQRSLGHSGLHVSAIGYGCMGLTGVYGAGSERRESIAVLHAAAGRSSNVGGQAGGRVLSAGTGIMKEQAGRRAGEHLCADDTIQDLQNHPAFGGFGRLLLPWDDRTYDSSMRVRDVDSLLPYHSHVLGEVHPIDRGRLKRAHVRSAVSARLRSARRPSGWCLRRMIQTFSDPRNPLAA